MKKLLSLFICFSLFLSLPFSLLAKEGVDVSDEPIPINESDDISLNSAGVGDSVYYILKSDGVDIFTGYMTIGQPIGWTNSQIDEILIRLPVDYNEPGVNVSFSAQLNLDNIVYQISTARFGETASPGPLKVTTLNGTNVGTSGNCAVTGTIENNSSDSMPYIWFQLKFYVSNTSGDYSFTLNNVSFSLIQSQIDYSDILNTINTNVTALQGGLNNIYSRLGDISNGVSSVLQVVSSIESLTNTISTNLSSFHTDVTSHFLNLQSQLVGHFRDLTALLINQYNSWTTIFQDYVDLFTSGNSQSQETVDNTDKTNEALEGVTNEHDKIEQDATNDFNSAIADVDINQGTDFLTSMSASFTWVGTQMTTLFNYGGQIQYLLMYSLILGFALVLIGRGLK